MKTQGILFDMDGVLTDTEPVINAAAIAGLREFGVQASPEDFTPFVGTGEVSYIGGVARVHGAEYVPEMKDRVYEIYLDLLPAMIDPVPGVEDLLRSLRDLGVPMAVATSADRIKMEANLAAIGVPLEWFGGIVVAEDVAEKKPSPEIYLTAARRLALAPEACCVVEDAVHGVQAAKRAGCRCVAVEGSFAGRELAEAGADVVRCSMAEVGLSDLGLGGSGVRREQR
jgi:HAD superfamily hydrolase (TIGR01509 family)